MQKADIWLLVTDIRTGITSLPQSPKGWWFWFWCLPYLKDAPVGPGLWAFEAMGKGLPPPTWGQLWTSICPQPPSRRDLGVVLKRPRDPFKGGTSLLLQMSCDLLLIRGSLARRRYMLLQHTTQTPRSILLNDHDNVLVETTVNVLSGLVWVDHSVQ